MLHNLWFIFHKLSFIPYFYLFLLKNNALKFNYQPTCLKVNGTQGFTADNPPLASALSQQNRRYVNNIILSIP